MCYKEQMRVQSTTPYVEGKCNGMRHHLLPAAGTLLRFEAQLRQDEKSAATIEKYLRYARMFAECIHNVELTKEAVVAWKADMASRYTATGTNGMITAVNSFLRFLGRGDLRVTTLRVQRQTLSQTERQLQQGELNRLIQTAERQNKHQLALMLQTFASTGIRVSELPYITAEAAESGFAEIMLKGKVRTIILPKKLCKKLLHYAKCSSITSGAIFLSKSGKPIDRFTVWRWMKGLCASAGVAAQKVFPHNLRKLFARLFYAKTKSLADLADILGHSDINTTRIYSAPTSGYLRGILDRLNL